MHMISQQMIYEETYWCGLETLLACVVRRGIDSSAIRQIGTLRRQREFFFYFLLFLIITIASPSLSFCSRCVPSPPIIRSINSSSSYRS